MAYGGMNATNPSEISFPLTLNSEHKEPGLDE